MPPDVPLDVPMDAPPCGTGRVALTGMLGDLDLATLSLRSSGIVECSGAIQVFYTVDLDSTGAERTVSLLLTAGLDPTRDAGFATAVLRAEGPDGGVETLGGTFTAAVVTPGWFSADVSFDGGGGGRVEGLVCGYCI